MHDIPAEAKAAGFSTIQWLRAMTFVEHTVRMEHSGKYEGVDRPAPCEPRSMGLKSYLNGATGETVR